MFKIWEQAYILIYTMNNIISGIFCKRKNHCLYFVLEEILGMIPIPQL